jgi:hypothetical protein
MNASSRAVAARDEQAIEPYRMPLPEVQLPEVGRLRLGGPMEPIIDKQTGKQRLGKTGQPVMKMGRPLDSFRATAPIREDLEELARVYGDPSTIQPWQSPDGPQWQTVLTQPVIHVALPPYSDTLVGPRYETYNAGHYMTRHCDGRTCWVPNKEAKRWEPKRCLCSPDDPECAQVTRLKVVVLGVPAHGVWRVECHGAYAARHWPAQVQMAQDLARDGRPVPATIRIESKTGRSAVFGKSLYKVPVLRLEQAFVLGGAPVAVELPDVVIPSLPAPSEPLPPDEPIDAEYDETEVIARTTTPATVAAPSSSTSPGNGDAGTCRSCGAPITWGLTAAGKRCPFNPDGTSHFGTCPDAKTWTKKQGESPCLPPSEAESESASADTPSASTTSPATRSSTPTSGPATTAAAGSTSAGNTQTNPAGTAGTNAWRDVAYADRQQPANFKAYSAFQREMGRVNGIVPKDAAGMTFGAIADLASGAA